LQARLKRNKTYFLPGCGFALISWVIGGASCEPIALFILTNEIDMRLKLGGRKYVEIY
jgi:hypothetical protein